MAKVIIFGVKDFASLAHFYLKEDSEHEVVAFSVHSDYLPKEGTFAGLPVVAFEEIEKAFPPQSHRFFAPMSQRQMNQAREAIYNEIKRKGYLCISYVSTKTSSFSNVEIGENCFILEDNTLQPFTRVGNNVMMWSGNHIGHHTIIKDHVFITSHVVLSGHCLVKSHCFFGVNSSIKNGLKIAEGCFIAMGSTVTRDTMAWRVYRGNPAKMVELSSEDLNWETAK